MDRIYFIGWFFPSFLFFSRHRSWTQIWFEEHRKPMLPLRNIATNSRCDDRLPLSIVLVEKETDFYVTYIPSSCRPRGLGERRPFTYRCLKRRNNWSYMMVLHCVCLFVFVWYFVGFFFPCGQDSPFLIFLNIQLMFISLTHQ